MHIHFTLIFTFDPNHTCELNQVISHAEEKSWEWLTQSHDAYKLQKEQGLKLSTSILSYTRKLLCI